MQLSKLNREDPKLTWDDIKDIWDELEHRDINSIQDLEKLIADRSELDALLNANYAWRYIRQSCDTTNQDYQDSFNNFVENIQPQWIKISDVLNKKIMDNNYVDQLDERYMILIRSIRKTLELYREENIPLFEQEQKLETQYESIISQMSIEYDGKEITMQQASKLLESKDRDIRKTVYDKTIARRMQDKQAIHEILDQIIQIRTQIAQNCGYKTYTEYAFVAKGRYDYTIDQVNQFHESVKEISGPILEKINQRRKEKLGYSELMPYDYSVNLYDHEEITPYIDEDDLIKKTASCLDRVYSGFGDYIKYLKDKNMLDLTTRKGKRAGGYNYGIPGTDTSFIFMNATNDSYGMMTMIHESGHALHGKYTEQGVSIEDLKCPPAEICEVASMGMELMSFDHLDVFIQDKKSLDIAKIKKLEDDLSIFPWISKIDLFQQWLYNHPNHTHQQREDYRDELCRSYPYGTGILSYDAHKSYGDDITLIWQKQSHIFSYPFYYIEYGIAQLGAISLWIDYIKDPAQAVNNYINFMKLGYTVTLPKLFEAGGMRFEFGKDHISTLTNFVYKKLQQLYSDIDG